MRLSNSLKYSFIALFCLANQLVAQEDYSVIKAQFSAGVNEPSQDGFVRPFEARGVNFPTINLGIQYMLNAQFGAKLDFGYNRMSSAGESPEFKLNYNRFNLQAVYDLTPKARFLPVGTGLVLHAGPGYSLIQPLGLYGANKNSFLNAMVGFEFHYKLTRTTSVYIDPSYIMALGGDFDSIPEAYGSFNGDLITFSVGLSLSLSGCRTCN